MGFRHIHIFGGFIFPFFGEMDCTVFDFVPGEGHEVELKDKNYERNYSK